MTRQPQLGGLLHRLACPVCGSTLDALDTFLRCAKCAVVFPVTDGIPLLTPEIEDPEKEVQVAFYDEHEDVEHETLRPWDRPRFHAWLLEEKFRLATQPLSRLLRERPSTLIVCGGAGLDAELLSRFGGEVVTSDISAGASQRALERARQRGAQYIAIVADAERLPFQDRSIDLVFVHDGLHHLPDPHAGVLEMLRVARRAISITEPTPSPATEIAMRVGMADRVEEAGNLVSRIPLPKLQALAVGAGFEILRSLKYGMFYRDGTGVFTRVSSLPGTYPAAQALTRATMRLTAPIGNKLVLVAARGAT